MAKQDILSALACASTALAMLGTACTFHTTDEAAGGHRGGSASGSGGAPTKPPASSGGSGGTGARPASSAGSGGTGASPVSSAGSGGAGTPPDGANGEADLAFLAACGDRISGWMLDIDERRVERTIDVTLEGHVHSLTAGGHRRAYAIVESGGSTTGERVLKTLALDSDGLSSIVDTPNLGFAASEIAHDDGTLVIYGDGVEPWQGLIATVALDPNALPRSVSTSHVFDKGWVEVLSTPGYFATSIAIASGRVYLATSTEWLGGLCEVEECSRIHTFDIDASGMVTESAGSPIAVDSILAHIVATRDGTRLYGAVLEGGSYRAIHGYSIDPGSGTVEEVSRTWTMEHSYQLAVSENRCLYATKDHQDVVEEYQIEASGVLTERGAFGWMLDPRSISVGPRGRFVAVVARERVGYGLVVGEIGPACNVARLQPMPRLDVGCAEPKLIAVATGSRLPFGSPPP